MGKSLDELVPQFRAQVERGLALLAERQVPHVLFCTGRSAAEQADAFRRGASKCDGVNVKSPHQLGKAADIVALDSDNKVTWDYRKYANVYKAIRDAGRECGMECGGDWFPSEFRDVGLGWDPPHWQFKS